MLIWVVLFLKGDALPLKQKKVTVKYCPPFKRKGIQLTDTHMCVECASVYVSPHSSVCVCINVPINAFINKYNHGGTYL